MTPEAQRIAIAEACGYRLTEWDHHQMPYWTKDGKPAVLADYLNDLNAMHEAEEILEGMSLDTKSMYLDYLALMHAELFEKRRDGLKRDPFDREWAVFRSTAAQRAEAFLRTIGKWEDESHFPRDGKGETK